MSQLSELLSFVIPAGIGSAMSPTLLITSVGVLSQPRHPRLKGTALLVGGIASLLLWMVIVYSAIWALLKQVESDAQSHQDSIDMVLGFMLLLTAFYMGREKRSATDDGDPHEEKDKDERLWHYAALGAVLQGRDITSIVLFIAALQHIAASGVPLEVKGLTLVGLSTLTLLPLWLPLVAHITIPHGALNRAAPLVKWIRIRIRPIGMGVCMAFGLYLIVRGYLEQPS